MLSGTAASLLAVGPLAPAVTGLLDHAARAGLVDVDATVFVQAAFFLILVVVLPGLIFKPMLARIEQREARTEGARAEAKSMRHAADEQVAAYEQATAEEKRRALAERAEVRAATQKMAADMVATARAETTTRIDAGLAAQRRTADAAREALRKDAATLSTQIADKLVQG